MGFPKAVDLNKITLLINNKNLLDQKKFNISVITVPVEGLATLGAKTSTGTAMANYACLIYIRPALDRWGKIT